jgi:hypothetical protein
MQSFIFFYFNLFGKLNKERREFLKRFNRNKNLS